MLLDAPGFAPAALDFVAARPQLLGGFFRAAVRAEHLAMTSGSVLDILIYVFDRYMLDEAPEVPEREDLAQDLRRAGFAAARVERALDWLTDLACGQRHSADALPAHRGLRLFTESESARLSTDCRGLVLRLEDAGVLTPSQREIVIERMLALDADEPDTEQLKWVVLMVLSSQPGQEAAVERLGGVVAAEAEGNVPH
ncbi:MAG TPA: DUF494 domain-containing protein [Steroidobacteraceae bacterium]|nr:DUF494 domain-containing protein [Steroidobacteraceae bacterium]